MLMRIRNRSIWASGSGKVPSISIGFCVAMTKKGRGRARVWPSTVTWDSPIASSRLAWVRGMVRFTSSARRTLAITGPVCSRNSPVFWS